MGGRKKPLIFQLNFAELPYFCYIFSLNPSKKSMAEKKIQLFMI